MSKFGGIPVESGGGTSKFGGIPIDAPQADESTFLGDMGENFKHAIRSGKDLLTGNYEDIGDTQNTPKTQALADKLFPQGYEGGVMEAFGNLGNTDASDFSGAVLEKFGNTPEGKALAVIAGLNPAYNAAGTVINRYVNPAIEEATGVHHDNLALMEMAAAPLGLKNAKNVKDPNIALIKKAFNKTVTAPETTTALPAKASLPKAAQKVYDRLRADIPDEAQFQKALASYQSSNGKSLLEMGGEKTKNLAEGASQYPTGAAKANEFFGEAINNAGDKLKGSVKKNISANELFYKSLDDIVTSGREKAAPLYDNAFKSNQSVSSPLIDRILATPEGKSALSEASKNLQNEMSRVAVPDKELTALAKEVSELGLMKEQNGGVASGLKLRTLDEVKKAMDSNINKAYRAGDEAEARRIIGLKKALVGELDTLDSTGLYAKARKTSGDYLSNKDAMESGLNFLREDAEIVQRSLKDFGPSEKTAYKSGVVKALRNEIDTKFDGQNVARFINKKSTREKLQAVLPEKEYLKFIEDAKAVDNIYKLRNELTGNSRTNLRRIASEEFDSEGAAIIQEVAQSGFIATGRKGIITFITKKFDGLSDKLAGEVADILLEISPKAKYRIVKQLTEQSKGSGAKSTEAQNKLVAIYGTLDSVSAAKDGVMPAIIGEAGNPQRLNVEINPTSGNPMPKIDLPNTGAQSSNFDDAVTMVMKTEGGYVADDAGKGETNMGINKSANPDVNIKNLTPAKARERYRTHYWNAIKADELPPEIATIAFDAAVNQGVGAAKRFLRAAKGDPEKLLQLRKQHYDKLVKNNPGKYKKYYAGWMSRLNELATQFA